jgi:hypothetical protein
VTEVCSDLKTRVWNQAEEEQEKTEDEEENCWKACRRRIMRGSHVRIEYWMI